MASEYSDTCTRMRTLGHSAFHSGVRDVGVVILNTICLGWGGEKKNGLRSLRKHTHRRAPPVAGAGTGPGITAELVTSPGLTGKIPPAREPQTRKR